MVMETVYECGFCNGWVLYDTELLAWVHAEAGDRVTIGGAGDFVSANHNRAGTVVNPADVVESEAPLMIEVSDEQRLMLVSAARVMIGQVVRAVDDAQRDVAWERVFGSNPKALSDAEYMLSLAVESEENWKRLVKQLR